MQILFQQVQGIVSTNNTKPTLEVMLFTRKYGHYALIIMGEDYDFPDGTDTRWSNAGEFVINYQVLEDRLI